jgi:hypothetical protein
MRAVADRSVTIFTRPVPAHRERPDATLGDGAESSRSCQQDDVVSTIAVRLGRFTTRQSLRTAAKWRHAATNRIIAAVNR